MAKQSVDPLRAQLLELTDKLQEHTAQLRDFGTTPGNVWLARGELQTITTVLGDLESLLEDIRAADYEAGY